MEALACSGSFRIGRWQLHFDHQEHVNRNLSYQAARVCVIRAQNSYIPCMHRARTERNQHGANTYHSQGQVSIMYELHWYVSALLARQVTAENAVNELVPI